MNKDRIPEQQLKQIKKVLVIQLGPIGDALLTTSYFRALKEYLPGIELHYLIKQQYVKAIANHPLIDKIVPIAKGRGMEYYRARWEAVKQIRAEKYDLVIDQQNMPASQIITALSGAPLRLGYADARFSSAYNYKAPRREIRYSAQRKFDIVIPLGMKEQKADIFFYIDDAAHDYVKSWLKAEGLAGKDFVCMSPSSPIPRKKWNAGNFAKLADRIVAELGLPVVFVWAPNELTDVEAVREQMNEQSILAPKTSLMEVAALLKRGRLLLCNDGGLNHLAVATKTETLAFFGNTDPADWSPASVYSHHHHLYNPRHDSSADFDFGISPNEAFRKVCEILKVKEHAPKN